MVDRVSILIPAYNAQSWLADTIRSSVVQTWPNKEVIVVDDGSKDATVDIAESFSHAGVRLIRQQNAGACRARNTALDAASGDYIQWLDADDLLHPRKLEFQMAAIAASGSDTDLFTSAWGHFYYRPEKAIFKPDALWHSMSSLDWVIAKFRHNAWMNPAVWLMSRRLAELTGRWDERLSLSGDDDGEYIVRAAAHSANVVFVERAISYYRIGTPGSLNWNMGKSHDGLSALALSILLSVDHLLEMDDSPRTRAACLCHLNNLKAYFYGADPSLQERLAVVAVKLGSAWEPPRSPWKYRPLEICAGPENTMRLMNYWRGAKLLMHGRWDKLMLDLTRREPLVEEWRP